MNGSGNSDLLKLSFNPWLEEQWLFKDVCLPLPPHVCMGVLLACMSVYYKCASIYEGQKKALDLLKLKLQTVVSHCVGDGN